MDLEKPSNISFNLPTDLLNVEKHVSSANPQRFRKQIHAWKLKAVPTGDRYRVESEKRVEFKLREYKELIVHDPEASNLSLTGSE